MKSMWTCLAVAMLFVCVAGCEKSTEPEDVTVYDEVVDGKSFSPSPATDSSLVTGKWGAVRGADGGDPMPTPTPTPTPGGLPVVTLTGDAVADVKATLAAVAQADLNGNPALLVGFFVPEQAAVVRPLVTTVLQIPAVQKTAVDTIRAKLGDEFADKLQGGGAPDAGEATGELMEALAGIDKLGFELVDGEVIITDPESPEMKLICRQVDGQYRVYVPFLDSDKGKQLIALVPGAIAAITQGYANLTNGVNGGTITAENFDQTMAAESVATMGKLLPLVMLFRSADDNPTP